MVSVIVTFHNDASYAEECIKSILVQSYKNIEIILINDGSTDGTEKICQEYAKNYTNIKYFYLNGEGVSVARNLGIRESIGDYIMFVDGDDCLTNDIIKILYSQLNNDIDIIGCSCTAFIKDDDYECHFFDSTTCFETIQDKEKLYLQLLNTKYGQKDKKIYTAFGVPWGKLYRTSFLKENELEFKEGLIRMQDNVFNMYAFFKAHKIIYYNFPLYRYRVNHILSYKKAYDPEIYLEISKERKKFLEENGGFFSEEVKNEFYKSFISCCMISLKNIALSNKITKSINKMMDLCNNEFYKDVLKNKSIVNLRNTDKIAINLIKFKLFFLIHILLNIKDWVNNRKSKD